MASIRKLEKIKAKAEKLLRKEKRAIKKQEKQVAKEKKIAKKRETLETQIIAMSQEKPRAANRAQMEVRAGEQTPIVNGGGNPVKTKRSPDINSAKKKVKVEKVIEDTSCTPTAVSAKAKKDSTSVESAPQATSLPTAESSTTRTSETGTKKDAVHVFPRRMNNRVLAAYSKAGVAVPQGKLGAKGQNKLEALSQTEPLALMYQENSLKYQILLGHLQELVFYTLNLGPRPQWMLLLNKQFIKKVVILFVPGLRHQEFSTSIDGKANPNGIQQPCESYTEWPSRYENVKKIFYEAIPITGPGKGKMLDSSLDAMLTKSIEEIKSKAKPKNRTLEEYAITLEELEKSQMRESEMTVRHDQVIVTAIKDKTDHPIIAMDCEMCLCESGMEVTHISIVDGHRNLIFDSYVIPTSPIIDYLTKFSGITKEVLEGVTTTLKDVQIKLQALIGRSTVIVGHGLNNDLKCLQFRHDMIVDTSVLYDSKRGKPYTPGLAYLAKTYLKREIQLSASGHNPVEDARAALDLVNLKIEKGEYFGRSDQEYHSFCGRLEVGGKHCSIVDTSVVIRKYGSTAKSSVECKTDEDVCQGIASEISKSDFVFGRLRELESLYSMTKDGQTDPVAYNEDALDSNYIRSTTVIDGYIGQIWNGLPPNTMLMCVSSHGDSMLASALLKKKAQSRASSRPTSPGDSSKIEWGPINEEQLSKAVAVARMGTAFVAIKHANS